MIIIYNENINFNSVNKKNSNTVLNKDILQKHNIRQGHIGKQKHNIRQTYVKVDFKQRSISY